MKNKKLQRNHKGDPKAPKLIPNSEHYISRSNQTNLFGCREKTVNKQTTNNKKEKRKKSKAKKRKRVEHLPERG